ncbi:polysaccharide pyruvyl transferase family protein [Cellulomonas sp. S1-8]|uniref:polysaccharide pyruvyl transferase family protein n=1 Tax=Cellulomonas sp. S1-8 TaxID=2904790 RepID=UPI002243B75E|nr:polysaccharide pyruvyl transferase family protein [Cellulomonas sp. S1-8]UZN04119.1 polysaccharide pyruvyl transferase family protein [Cellulomonas sp. S1-8]
MDVFVSAVGQHDNIGDTVLRRAYLDVVRPLGRLHVFVGDKPDGYVAGLRLGGEDVVHRAPASWRAAVRQGLLTGACYGFDSGETEVRRPYAKRYARLAPLLAVNRARGGIALQVGTGVREAQAWRLPISAVLRLCDVVTWRDGFSRDLMRVGTVAPDWGFALGPDETTLRADTDRPLLAVAVRQGTGDVRREPPDAAWAARVRTLADGLGLTPVVVTQVGRDGPTGDRLAHDLGAEHVAWHDDDHAGQEDRLRDVYRRCRYVLSDRLHVVVVAATEGAVPVGLTAATAPGGAPDKVERTLTAAGLVGTCLPRDVTDVDRAHATLAGIRRDDVVDAVLDARAQLAVLADRIHAAAGTVRVRAVPAGASP